MRKTMVVGSYLPIRTEPSVILVNRSDLFTYPNWVKKVLHPELKLLGPSEYDLKEGVDIWFHPGQKNANIKTQTVHEHLQEKKILQQCFGIVDGLAILNKDVEIFTQLFGAEDKVMLWKSAVESLSGVLFFPFIYINASSQLVIGWLSAGSALSTSFLTPKFKEMA